MLECHSSIACWDAAEPLPRLLLQQQTVVGWLVDSFGWLAWLVLTSMAAAAVGICMQLCGTGVRVRPSFAEQLLGCLSSCRPLFCMAAAMLCLVPCDCLRHASCYEASVPCFAVLCVLLVVKLQWALLGPYGVFRPLLNLVTVCVTVQGTHM